MKEYLEKRIKHLKKVEMEYYKKSIDKGYSQTKRDACVDISNEFAARRSECEITLKKFIAEPCDL